MKTSEDGFFLEAEGHEYIFYNDIDRSYERQNFHCDKYKWLFIESL